MMANFNIPAPITLPKLDLPDIDEIEAKEVAARFAELRTIREGLDRWRELDRINSSCAGWLKIGAALRIGKQRALYVTGANAPWGRNYSREFGQWMIEHGFGHMPKAVRSVAIELVENEQAISTWRDTLSEKQRQRLRHPLSITRRWRAETQPNDKPPPNLRKATIAWRRFTACMGKLPPSEAAQLKATVSLWMIAFDCDGLDQTNRLNSATSAEQTL
jgi:hypothetical protein